MNSLYKALDIFAFRIDFNYKNERVFNSLFGFFLSIFAYSAMIFFFFYFAHDFFNKTNPIVMFKETEFEGNNSFIIKDFFSKFEYSYSIYDSNKIFGEFCRNKNDIIPVIYPQLNIFNDTSKSYESLIFDEKIQIDCSEENFSYDFSSDYTIEDNHKIFYWKGDLIYISSYPENLNKKIFKYRNLKDINLKIDSNSRIVFNLIFQSNYTQALLNKDLDISNFKINYIIKDIIMNVEKFEYFSSFNLSKRLIFSSFLNDANDYYLYNFGLIELIDDEGFIISEKKNRIKLKKSYETQLRSKFGNKITIFESKFDKIKKIYERRYKKLQNVFADIGGLINSLIIMGNIIIYGFNRNFFYYEIINNIFEKESLGDVNKRKKNFQPKNLKNMISEPKLKIDKKIKILEKNDISSRSIGSFLNHPKNIARSQGNDGSNKFFEDNVDNKNLDNVKYEILNKIKDPFSSEFPNDGNCPKDDFKGSVELAIDNKNSITFDKIKRENETLTKEKIDQFLNSKKKKQKTIDFTNMELLKMIICCKRFKNEDFLIKENMFKKLTQKLSDYMNIINYCLLFENFEKLKMILLNENQNFSFDYLETKKNMDSSSDQTELGLRNVYKYFNSKIEHLNEVDNRLFNNFSLKFSSFLNLKP